jgi:hypothetical protein
VLLDAVGAKRGLRAYRKRLQARDIEVRAMLPGGLRWRRSGRMDLRNHRKIAVIDNEVAYVGSQNLAGPQFVPGHPNRELVARVRGPAVAHLEAVFASDWYMETGQRLDVIADVPECSDDIATQLLPSGPAYPYSNARCGGGADPPGAAPAGDGHPYFVPDEATLSALRIAALSGVQVQLILSASNNQRLTSWAQEAYYDELLRCGVRIALYEPQFLHAKHMSVDEDIAVLGSINMDIRSFALNAEIGLICYDRALVQQLCAIEDGYLRVAAAGSAAVAQPPHVAAQPRRHRTAGRCVDVKQCGNPFRQSGPSSPMAYNRHMTDSPRNGELDLAIIGGGAAGVLVAIQVLRQAKAPLALAIFEPASQLAQGIAYATPWPEHLLNVPAAKMSAFADQPGDFLDYLMAANAYPGEAREVLGERYVCRHYFAATCSSACRRPLRPARHSCR